MKNLLLILSMILLLVTPSWATVSSTPPIVQYSCNGSSANFGFSFYVDTANDLQVQVTTSGGTVNTLVQGASSDYTVSCTNNDCSNGGTVILNTPSMSCVSGSTLTIETNIPLTQSTSFTEYMPTLYKTFEGGLDKLTAILKQQTLTPSISSYTWVAPLQFSPSTQTISMLIAGPAQNGYLSSSDWNNFNGKQSTLSQANGSTSGYLYSGDWTTFNNKQGPLTFSTSLSNSGGTVTLLNDASSPGNSYCYMTSGAGVKGWYTCPGSGSGGMVWPGGNGVPIVSGGNSWGTTLTVGTAANNLVQLTTAAKLPAVDGSLLTNLPAGTISGSTGSTNNAIITANGTGGSTVQASTATISSGVGTFPAGIVVNKTASTAGSLLLNDDYLSETYGVILIGPHATSSMGVSYGLQFPATQPTSGQFLQASTPQSNIAALSWVNPPSQSGASGQKQVSTPTYPNSNTSYTMQGLAGSITPVKSGNILITISGIITTSSNTAAQGVLYQISYGTSTAPTNNASLTGTQVGTVQQYANPTTVTASDVKVPFSISAIVTGLSLSTPYWIDLAAEDFGAGSICGFHSVNVAAIEF